MKKLRFKKKYFEMVRCGQKSLECRVCYPSIRKIKIGDVVRYFWENQKCDVRIIDIRLYNNFYDMLKKEDINKLVPGMNLKQSMSEYQRIYPKWKVEKFGGIVVFEFILV